MTPLFRCVLVRRSSLVRGDEMNSCLVCDGCEGCQHPSRLVVSVVWLLAARHTVFLPSSRFFSQARLGCAADKMGRGGRPMGTTHTHTHVHTKKEREEGRARYRGKMLCLVLLIQIHGTTSSPSFLFFKNRVGPEGACAVFCVLMDVAAAAAAAARDAECGTQADGRRWETNRWVRGDATIFPCRWDWRV